MLDLHDLRPLVFQASKTLNEQTMTRAHAIEAATSPWVIRLPVSDAQLLAHLRLIADLRILVQQDIIWLRGDSNSAPLAYQIRSIPNAEWFSIRDDGLITRRDETVPCDRFPDGEWVPIREWFDVELPQAGFAVATYDKVQLKLTRSTTPQTANVLRTRWEHWYEYAITAPQIRLNRLAFAVSDSNEVLIRGTPLPPIPGQGCVETNRIIIPGGWRFSPDAGAEVIGRLLGGDEQTLVVFSEDGSFELVPQSAFVQATRSSVRASNGA